MINLHSHLEGRVRPGTAAELAGDLGLHQDGWEQALRLDGPADLTVFLDKVGASYPFFRRPDHLARIACEAVEDTAADGGQYLELRFGPGTHARASGLPVADVVRAACEGVAEGTRRSGMPAGVVVAVLRTHPPELNLAVAQAAVRVDGVVGFDLAGDELRRPGLAPYEEFFAIARSAGLGLTCHAAEAAPGAAAREAVERFGVTRIGHGAHVADDPETLRWLADHGTVIEVCPTSNWFTGAIDRIDDHPAPRFLAAGIDVVLGDDNPVQTGSALSAERRLLHERLGFTDADLARMDEVGAGAAFGHHP